MVFRQYKLASFGETKRLLKTNDVLFYQLLFDEKLYVFNEDGRRIGRFSITASETNIQKCKAMLVHISNRAFFNGLESETVLTGILTQNLKTLEEFRYEASEIEETGKHERKFYLLREKTKYYYSVTQNISEASHTRQGTIPFAKTNGLISEAANVILLRSIAIRGYQGIICLKTILSNGKKCRNYYVSKISRQVVNGTKMEVMIVYRSVTNHKKYSVTSTCAFTRAGQLVYLFWSNSNCFLHVDPDLYLHERKVNEGKVGLERHWNRDKQLFSYYLDKKFEYHSSVRSFRVADNGVKRFEADWIQFNLMMRPRDLVCFMRNYFVPFSETTREPQVCKEGDEVDDNLQDMRKNNIFS